jgi:uncharacterized protein YueI
VTDKGPKKKKKKKQFEKNILNLNHLSVTLSPFPIESLKFPTYSVYLLVTDKINFQFSAVTRHLTNYFD